MQMKIIQVNERNLEIVQQNSECSVMALGFFDGVHKGHQQVILAAKEEAKKAGLKLAVMSFFPHPKTVFSNEEIDYLMPMEEKAERFKKLGVDLFYLIDFTKSFSALAPEQFIEQYLVRLNVQHAVAGYDYTYGKKGAGTIDDIAAHSNHRVCVTKVEKFALYGEKVSSTCIRSKLKNGQVEEIAVLLGRPYEVKYDVKNGVSSYYKLPEPGRYYVTIICGKRAISQAIYVQDSQWVSCQNELPTEECKIIFHQRVSQKVLKSS